MEFNYPTKEEIAAKMQSLTETRADDIVNHLLTMTKMNSLDELREKEYNCYFGFDCGFIYLVPNDEKMRKEWKKQDEWKKSDMFISHNYLPISLQSSTCNRHMISYMLEQLGLNDLFRIKVVLD